jgi:pimeloyl-ACP methyl ester carboxylesterase
MTQQVAIENNAESEVAKTVAVSYWNPFSYWLNSHHEHAIEDIEIKMLKNINVPINRYYVNIRNNSLKIWTLSANIESTNTPIVLIHGFCGGIALWAHNIEALSAKRPFYAFDLLGFGRSSRPSFRFH